MIEKKKSCRQGGNILLVFTKYKRKKKEKKNEKSLEKNWNFLNITYIKTKVDKIHLGKNLFYT